MNTAVILAGGIGSRMKTNIPKQFLLVNEKPVILYCLEAFQNHSGIDNILIVADEKWKAFVNEFVEKYNITKVIGYTEGGCTRQNSIYNALKWIDKNGLATDIVIIHDAARPIVSDEIISSCIKEVKEHDGAMPAIPVEDTIYQSMDDKKISNLLKRSELYAGQTPESFKFQKYYDIHNKCSNEEIMQTKGSSEIAYKHGMDIAMIPGDKKYFKITTMEDFKNFEGVVSHKD